MRPESHHKRQPAARAFGAKKPAFSQGKAARRRVREYSQAGAPDCAAAKNDEKGSLALPFKVVKTHLQKN